MDGVKFEAWLVIVGGALAVLFLIGRDERTATTGGRSYEWGERWKFFSLVGTSPQGVDVIIEANWAEEQLPDGNDSMFRVAERVGEKITPVAGKTQAYAFETWGRNESTEALDPNAWGVPYTVALEAAQARMSALQGVAGGIDPTAATGANGGKVTTDAAEVTNTGYGHTDDWLENMTGIQGVAGGTPTSDTSISNAGSALDTMGSI